MATHGYTEIAVTSYDDLTFSWTASESSIENNTTSVSWILVLTAGSSGRISSTAQKDWSVTVNGTKYSGTNTVGIGNNENKILASGKTTIKHNDDGTKTFSYSFSQEFAITFSGAYIGTKSGSGTGTLDTIPRKSTLSVSNGTLGTAQTLTVTRKATSFTHTITYKCGSASGTICTKSSNTSISWTPPLSLAQQNTTGTSVSVTFTLQTYTNSGTSVGSNSYTKTFSIPSSVKPSVSLAVSDPMGYIDDYGVYIQGLSKLKIVATASGSQGSTIKSYKTEADGKTYTAASVTTGFIVGTGTLTIKVTVTDSRGRTATASTTVSVLAYSFPKISALSVYRCDANGNAVPSGAYLAVKFSSVLTSLNGKNATKYTVQYKKSSETTYTEETLTAFAGQYSVSDGVFVFPAEVSSSYDIILTVSDAIKSVNKTASGASEKKVWSLLKKAGGIVGFAIGKIAELEGVFDVDLVIRARKGIVVDAEWVDLTIAEGFALYNGTVANQPKYKVTGNVVTVTGILTPETEFTSSTSVVTIASGIPEDLRPPVNLQFVCQGSMMNRWNCSVNTNGTVGLSRYGTTEATTVPVNAWLCFTVTYQI